VTRIIKNTNKTKKKPFAFEKLTHKHKLCKLSKCEATSVSVKKKMNYTMYYVNLSLLRLYCELDLRTVHCFAMHKLFM